jgi:hypothetical protein
MFIARQAARSTVGATRPKKTCSPSRIAKRVAGISKASEEILASLLGAMICQTDGDRVTLFANAAAELLDRGQSAESTSRQLQQLWDELEALL